MTAPALVVVRADTRLSWSAVGITAALVYVTRIRKSIVHVSPATSDGAPLSNCVPGSVSDPMPVKPGLATHGAEAVGPAAAEPAACPLTVGGPAIAIVGVPWKNAADSESATCRLVSGFRPVFLTSTVNGTSNA